MKRDSLFDKWFAFNYERLRAVFGRYLNEDAFHDAYLAMKKTCAFQTSRSNVSSLIFRRVQEM